MPNTVEPRSRRRFGPSRAVALGLAGAVVLGLTLMLALGFPGWWGPSADDLYHRALGAVEAGQFDEAEADLARLARLRAPTVLDWGLRARTAIAGNRNDEALDALGRIPDSHPLAAWAHLRAGQLELRRNRFPAAEAALKEALKLEPSLIEARRELISILGFQLRRRELDEQFEALAARSRLTALEVWIWCMARDLVWWTPSEHVPILEAALKADPSDRWSRLALAEAHRRQGYRDEAEAVLADLPPSDPDARAARVGLVLEDEDIEAAAPLLAEGPTDHAGLEALRGRLALTRGDARAAVDHLARALAADPDRRQPLADLGRAWIAAGDRDRAEPYLASAARIDALNNLLLRAETAVRTATPDPELWFDLASACETAGRSPEARAWYGVILDSDPLDARAQQALYRLRSSAQSPSTPSAS